MTDNFFERRAGGVVFRNNTGKIEYLLVTSNSNRSRWILPAGHIEENETPQAAAVREVMEEAGIAAGIVMNLGNFQHTWMRGQQKVALDTCLFLMEYQQTVSFEPEGRQVQFFSYEATMDLNVWEESRAFLEKAHLILSSENSSYKHL